MRDPNALREVLQMANDPEIMKQAKVSEGPKSLLWIPSALHRCSFLLLTYTYAEMQAMANDPEFKREVDKWLNSDAVQQSMKAAEEIAKDPKKLALFQKQLEDIVKTQKREYTGRQNAQLGMNAIADTMRDPNAMKEAMTMLKDPETVREVRVCRDTESSE